MWQTQPRQGLLTSCEFPVLLEASQARSTVPGLALEPWSLPLASPPPTLSCPSPKATASEAASGPAVPVGPAEQPLRGGLGLLGRCAHCQLLLVAVGSDRLSLHLNPV